MSRLGKFFGFGEREQEQEQKTVLELPTQVICDVHGFEAVLSLKGGVLLTEQETGHPASADYYYEVSLRPTGENPEYPAKETPSVMRYTVGRGQGLGIIGGTGYIPEGSVFTAFTLREEFDDGKNTMGRRMPPHHSVMLRAAFTNVATGHSSSMAMGGWVRRSETETRAWQNALGSRVMWF